MPHELRVKAQIKQPDVKHVTTGEIDPAQEIEQFLEAIAQYNKFGKVLRRESLKEIGERLAKIAEMAEVAVTNEASDWFDAHTLKRNMKEVKSYANDFLKLAQEADTLNQRMTALYDDMGRILERYFEIPDEDEEIEPAHPVGYEAELDLPVMPDEDEPQKLEEDDMPPLAGRDPRIYQATPLPPVKPDSKKMDELTLRAIKAVYKRLKAKNPETASKFAKLPPVKMKEVVWELATRV